MIIFLKNYHEKAYVNVKSAQLSTVKTLKKWNDYRCYNDKGVILHYELGKKECSNEQN